MLTDTAHHLTAPGLRTSTWIALGLIAAATLGGARLGRRLRRDSALPVAAAAGVLLGIVAGDLVPDIARETADTGLPWWLAGGTGVIGFVGAGWALRRGCPCEPGLGSGIGTALAVGVHRALEGAALAVLGSVAVAIGLVIHAGSEGFALTALLNAERPRRALGWLALACLSPAVGAGTISVVPLSGRVTALLTVLVAGVLASAAVTAYRVARQRSGHGLAVGGATTAIAAVLALTLLTLTSAG